MKIINVGPKGDLPESNKTALALFTKQMKSFEVSVYIGATLVVTLLGLTVLYGWVPCAFMAGYLTPQTIRCFSRARQMNGIKKLIEEGQASVVGADDGE